MSIISLEQRERYLGKGVYACICSLRENVISKFWSFYVINYIQLYILIFLSQLLLFTKKNKYFKLIKYIIKKQDDFIILLLSLNNSDFIDLAICYSFFVSRFRLDNHGLCTLQFTLTPPTSWIFLYFI